MSSETPAPPKTWIARSTIVSTVFGTTSLVTESSRRARRLPTVSSFQAAFRVSSLAWSISARERAMKSWMNWRSESWVPNISRLWARSHIISSARSATPISRMQWWMRPGPRRSWATLKPLPTSFRVASATGTRQSS